MKNLKISKKIIKILATGFTFILLSTRCSSKENTATPTTSETTVTTEDNNKSNENNTKEEFDCFESETKEIESLIDTRNFEKADEIYSDYFIDAVDFIFYGKEYKDTKFSELNPETQEKCLDEVIKMKNKWNEIKPNLEEDKQNIKNSAVEAYYNFLSNFEQLIGTENYDNLEDLIKDAENGIKNIGNDTVNMLDNAYQEYKKNHQK